MAFEQAQQLLGTQQAALAQSFDEAEFGDAVAAPAYAASYTPNVYKARHVVVMGTLTGNITIAAPIGARRGMQLTFVFIQDGTGSRTVTWNAVFKASANGAGAASTKGSTTFFYDGTNWVQDAGALTFK